MSCKRFVWQILNYTSNATKTTTIYQPEREPQTKPFSETLSGEDVLVGFTMNVADVLTF